MAIEEATTQISSPKRYSGKEAVSQESHPTAATGGWSSFLTWRKPKNPALISNTDTAISKDRAPRHGYSPTSGKTISSSRNRAPIPFDLGPRRTPSSSSSTSRHYDPFQDEVGSTSVMEVERGLVAAYDEDDNEIQALDTAFASLSRVRRRADSVSDSRNPTPPCRSPTSISSTPEPENTKSWLAWGSSTIRSTLPRGMVSSLFSPDLPTKAGYPDYPASPSTLTSTSSMLSSEKWKPAERDQVDYFVDRIIGFAGVDGKSRSIVTLSAPNLPPVDQISHDAILDRILVRTQPLVHSADSGYTLVLFASGSDSIDGSHGSKTAWPGWTWCWKAWRSLDRSYRKNLKRLYIVHPTFFTRTLVRLISTGSYFISPKFAKKIVQCNTLKDLDQHIPLDQLDIPPQVLIWNLKIGAKEEIEREDDMATVPIMVRDCVDALKGNSNAKCLLDIDGIFRVSPSNALLRSAKYAYQLNRRPNLERFVEKDVHLPAALLKSNLRSLPYPLFPASTYPTIRHCPVASDEELLHYLRETLLPTLDEGKLILLSFILQCLHEVSLRSDKNRMDSSNLATVMTPNLVCSEDPIEDVMMCRVQKIDHTVEGNEETTGATTTLGTIIAFCIERYYEVFDEIDFETPILNFEVDKEEKRNSLGTLTSSTKKSLDPRNLPSSPTHRSFRNNMIAPLSPSMSTLTTKRSTGSLRIKNRTVSGGSMRVGVNVIDKGPQSIALVGTSASGEFASNHNIELQSPSIDAEANEGEDSLLSLPDSPTVYTRRRANSKVDSGHRRPLSEVFEE